MKVARYPSPEGAQIRQLRVGENLTQVELAARLGVTSGLVANWEAGLVRPPVRRLRDLASILKLTLAEEQHLIALRREEWIRPQGTDVKLLIGNPDGDAA